MHLGGDSAVLDIRGKGAAASCHVPSSSFGKCLCILTVQYTIPHCQSLLLRRLVPCGAASEAARSNDVRRLAWFVRRIDPGCTSCSTCSPCALSSVVDRPLINLGPAYSSFAECKGDELNIPDTFRAFLKINTTETGLRAGETHFGRWATDLRIDNEFQGLWNCSHSVMKCSN